MSCSCFIISNKLCNLQIDKNFTLLFWELIKIKIVQIQITWVGPFWSMTSAPTLLSKASIVCLSCTTSFRLVGFKEGNTVKWFRWSSAIVEYNLKNENQLLVLKLKQKKEFFVDYYVSSYCKGQTPWFLTTLYSSGTIESGIWIVLIYNF